MTTRAVIGIVALLCVLVCGLVATLANLEMVDNVNEKLPAREQLATLGWYLSKYLRLYREYKRLYPDGRLHLKVRIVTTLSSLVYLFPLGVLDSSHGERQSQRYSLLLTPLAWRFC